MIGQTISNYRVLSRVGSGGMGVVYEAEDLDLGRHVALKFLPAALAADPQAVERFKREARAASALNHPHICTIHHVGVHEGKPFIVMELLQGQSLKQVRERPLHPDLLLDVAIQIADALETAHSSGVVHRDIKPANVFLTKRGEAKLLDFGLAKLVQRPGAPNPDTGIRATVAPDMVTEHGAIVGTVAYMSPEQVRGEELDARTDLFSFAALLYELATGHEPFTGRSDTLVFDAVLHHDPAPPSRLTPDLHPDLERIILKGLEKDRNLRYQTAADMRADLERLKRDSSGSRARVAAAVAAAAAGPDRVLPGERSSAPPARRQSLAHPVAGSRRRTLALGAGVLLLVAIAAGVAHWFAGRSPVLTERDPILIADFDNTTGEPVFDQTLKQALSVQLQQSPFLAILSDERVATTLRLMGRPPGERLTRTIAREVCQREGAKAMVAGSIAALAANYVITLESLSCLTGDVLATVQEEARGKEHVLQSIGAGASALRARLGEALPSVQKYDIPIREAATSSLEALKLYSMARLERDKGNDLAAVPLLERAVELDPDFAIAWSHLGAVLRNSGRIERGSAALTRAFELRDRVPEQERYFIASRYYWTISGDLDKARETNVMWARLFPRNWQPRHNLCLLYWRSWDTDRALVECREAVRLEPAGSFWPYDALVAFYIALGRFDEAKATATQGLARGVSGRSLHPYLADIAWLQADADALERERRWLQANAKDESATLQYQMALASGRLREAGKTRPVPPQVQSFVGRIAEGRKQAEALWTAAREESSFRVRTGMTLVAAGLGGDGPLIDRNARLVVAVNPESAESEILPCARAALELSRGNAAKAIELLEPARRHGLGMEGFTATYLRGLAFLRARQPREAAAEFDQIIAHPGVSPGSVLWPLSHLGLGRARALAGNSLASRSGYERFLALWKDADQDLPILQEAKHEHQRLGPVTPPAR